MEFLNDVGGITVLIASIIIAINTSKKIKEVSKTETIGNLLFVLLLFSGGINILIDNYEIKGFTSIVMIIAFILMFLNGIHQLHQYSAKSKGA